MQTAGHSTVSTSESRARSRPARLRSLAAGVLAAIALGCNGKANPSSLPPPPEPSERAETLLLILQTPTWEPLILYLDEVERWFEAFECWRAADSDCAFE